MNNAIIKAAELFAVGAHGAINQVRKYTGGPYVEHCRDVVNILLTFSQNQISDEQIIAAYLHDTVEDTEVTLEMVNHMFGPVVAAYVENLTDVSKHTDGNRKIRKRIDLEHTAKASPKAKSIKLADLISNTRSIVEHDPEFAVVYLKEKSALLEVLAEGDSGLFAEAKRVLADANKKLNLV